MSKRYAKALPILALSLLSLLSFAWISYGSNLNPLSAKSITDKLRSDDRAGENPGQSAESQDLQPQSTSEIFLPAVLKNGAVRFAVIGDYGNNSDGEARVASLVKGWNPNFVITTGDNNYPDGKAATIDANIGQYYNQFIGNYQGSYGTGDTVNRFWPSLGNHDWHTISCTTNGCSGAYFDYFTLPNNERYYEVDLGLIHIFALDSDHGEPDGGESTSIQGKWLETQLAGSTACYQLVYFHHAPYSSARHGSNKTMQWPFASWGAEAVFSGHDHVYERIEVNGIPYFVNGAGGAGLYNFSNIGKLPPEAESIVRYNSDHGAMLVTASSSQIAYQFYSAEGALIDTYLQNMDCSVEH